VVSHGPLRWRSVLFVPASRSDFLAKAPAAGADVVVLDLEDSVPPGEKQGARARARAAADRLLALDDGPAVVVRVNAPATVWCEDDIRDATTLGLAGVMVPKLQSAAEVSRLAEALDAAGGAAVGIVAGIETALAVAEARSILSAERVVAGYFGAEDFIADMGGVRRDDNLEVAYARARVSLAARIAGVPALDFVVTAFRDAERFRREAAEARALGYTGKLCIHPAQVALANEAFTPSPDEVARARRLLEAYAAALRDGRAALAFEGQMVDTPLVERARAVLRTADPSHAGSSP
jgi:citrate lyase subunit beta/citryl-CoA lyase